ncbi:MAG: hypothetical protein U5L09_01225 [Bacteroidales bacterium]|nr:hypothetical protein [Bacteroidales bacterium]
MKRLFAALPIPLSEEVKSNIRTGAKPEGERIRWIPAEHANYTTKIFW